MTDITRICASCGAAMVADSETCPCCDAPARGARPSLFRAVTGVAAERVRRKADDAGEIVLSSRDFLLLETLVSLRLPADDAIAHGLREKLARSRVVAMTSLPPGLVTLDSRVVFSVEGTPPESRVLVLPDGPSLYGWSLPVTTPRGLAMLGARAGTTVLAERREGGVERIAIHTVAYRPQPGVWRDRWTRDGAPGSVEVSPVARRRLRAVKDAEDEGPEPPAA